MSESSHGKTAHPGLDGPAAASVTGPPPSTLAAQLVENISTSTKSSRSDDSNELKGLVAIAQRMIDNPRLLRSDAEKMAHNHMLVYIYCRGVLEEIKLGDPFIDRAHVCGEVLNALKFLRFTIKETPALLTYVNEGQGLLHRGNAPLWIWLLPRLLRILGHADFAELETHIEAFLQYLFLVCCTSSFWDLALPLSLYLRACLTGLLDHLQDPPTNPPSTKTTTMIQLPPQFAVDQIIGKLPPDAAHRTTYVIRSTRQAIRQATGLARVLAYPFVSQESSFLFNASFAQNGPWLMDTWLDLRHVQKRWEESMPESPVPLIETALDVAKCPIVDTELVAPMKNKSYALLVLLCSELISSPEELVRIGSEGDRVRVIYCKALIAIAAAAIQIYAVGRLAASKLVQELALLSSQHSAIGEGTDLWRCTRLLRQAIYSNAEDPLDDATRPSCFQNQEVRECVQGLNLIHEGSSLPAEGSKRRKISDMGQDAMQLLIEGIRETLRIEFAIGDDGSEFEEHFLRAFETCDEPKSQSLALDLLSRLCCIADGTIQTPKPTTSPGGVACSICDDRKPVGAASLTAQVWKSRVLTILSGVIQLPSLQETRAPRVAAMISLRRLLQHSNELLDLEQSALGKWCLQSLNSSIRELRVAAGRTLAMFTLNTACKPMETDILTRNRVYAIAALRTMSEDDQPKMVETRVMAWGQLGRAATEDELTLVLIKLVEYLGSSNIIVSAFAFNEILGLAEFRAATPRRLFEPNWKSLAYMVTKDMVQRPQRSRAIAELLQISVNELLLLIQTHALPWLVLDKRQDVIQKIAEARRENEPWQPLLDGTNLAATLALLLVHDPDNMQEFTKSRLNEISPHFHSLTLLDLFQSEPVLIAMELLKSAACSDLARRKAAHKALHLMATTILGNTRETKSKKDNTVGRFLQSHMLGLVARLADVINDSVTAHPLMLEQRNCIQTMEEMIKVCKSYARIARPQMSACLVSAISQEALRAASFSCWVALLTHLDEEDVQALIETTFFIVKHYWPTFDEPTAKAARDMLTHLLQKHQSVVEEYICKLPSLSHIDELASIDTKLMSLRPVMAMDQTLGVFTERLAHDNSGVVHQALTELVPFLRDNQSGLCTSAVSQMPDKAITSILRALLDCVSKYNGVQVDISRLCVESIGLIGCLDSNQIETVREKRSIVVLHNFEDPGETTDFVLFLLQEVLVPSFLSATDTKLQGFLSYAMQELLDRSDVKTSVAQQNIGRVDGESIYRKWVALPENTREVLTPFMSSRYMVAPMPPVTVEYPIFHAGKPYVNWLRSFVVDLLRKGQNGYAELMFEPLTRVIRVKDLSTAEFLLPYLVLHVLIGTQSTPVEREQVVGELLGILEHRPAEDASYMEKEETKRFCHAVFRILDYAMRWVQEKRSSGKLSSAGREIVSRVQKILDGIPAELISQRATDCNEYARALFHLEQHAQNAEQRKGAPGAHNRLLDRLQDIYANIDEPDGLEGISAHLHDLDINQQILSHKKAGRWDAAQTWYEMQLAEKPDNVDVQLDLLNCLKQAGQHDVLLNHVEGMNTSSDNRVMPYAVEAAWVTGRWESLAKFTSRFQGNIVQDFNISIATLFESLRKHCTRESFDRTVRSLRDKIALEMTTSATASLQAAHELLLRCHVLTDLEIIVGAISGEETERRKTMGLLDGRLEVIGAYFSDKQYLLGIRRAAMELTRPNFGPMDISSLWLASARLARKTNSLHQSFNAVVHASQLGDDAATIENAKLLWRDKHHRKAIQMLQGAIERNKLMTQTGVSASVSAAGTGKLTPQQKMVTARAQLLLAKWLDAAGQSYAGALREKYQQPPKTHTTWEKGHYYLGRHYKKVLEAEQSLKADEQTDNYLSGEIARLVIENYLRSLNSGTKYLYQTLPRILTLWLDLGAQTDKPPEGKTSLSRELHRRRVEQLNLLHAFLDKYIHRLPAYIFYTALPQLVARIAHPNPSVFDRLTHIIVKVVEAHPRQALWSLMGIITTRQASERRARGAQILQTLRTISRKVEGGSYDLKQLIRAGEKLAEQLLLTCQIGEFQGSKAVHASLTRDLRFQHKCTPCPLVVPVESCLTATLPAVSEQVKKHKAFSRDVVTIDCFLDDVLVLSSMQRPKRITARGTDGKNYMLLLKPKDDLRTDQRLMEFNGIINRSLKRDAESSRRQLYIRTYAVVPLNEECGIIEWVPGIKTMRDILLNLYAAQKIHIDYNAVKHLMQEAASSESKIRLFTDDVLGRFPPVLPTWFIQQFPNPSAWFAARLKYTRSCAVMSMVGTILGLGDRHTENVNLEEGNGGVFHVDFNCLFDKGRTFATPERVPFRLTHNMVAAMGIYGYEGPFRKSSELTLSILRQQEETLMTILEAFIYDPTLDLQREKRASKRSDTGVRLQPQSVVDSIRRKVRGLLPNESIPLSVEGQVDELIKQAVDPRNLTAMYLGWCPFL